jgi:hypothetical protein
MRVPSALSVRRLGNKIHGRFCDENQCPILNVDIDLISRRSQYDDTLLNPKSTHLPVQLSSGISLGPRRLGVRRWPVHMLIGASFGRRVPRGWNGPVIGEGTGVIRND